MDKQTLIEVTRKLSELYFEKQAEINPNSKNITKTLRQLSRTYGINDCIDLVETMLLQFETE